MSCSEGGKEIICGQKNKSCTCIHTFQSLHCEDGETLLQLFFNINEDISKREVRFHSFVGAFPLTVSSSCFAKRASPSITTFPFACLLLNSNPSVGATVGDSCGYIYDLPNFNEIIVKVIVQGE